MKVKHRVTDCGWTPEEIAELLLLFKEKYNDLYDGVLKVDKWEMAKAFDAKMESDADFNKLVNKFVAIRMDFISSDREAAAFMLALEEYMNRGEKS